MEWTGERFIPGIGTAELAYEHFSRYLFALRLVEGQRVLDVGSGEGYGAYLMAEMARSVTGVDISESAVEYARGRYIKENLRFAVSSETAFPLDGPFDRITCFEVIEHLSEEHQHALLSEMSRTLDGEGVALISTPNKAIYNELDHASSPSNSFHLREMSFDQFNQLLRNYFDGILWFGQQMISGNCVQALFVDKDVPRGEPSVHLGAVADNRLVTEGLPPHTPVKYLMALCAKEPEVLARLTPPREFVFVDLAGSAADEWRKTSAWAQRLDREHNERGVAIRQLMDREGELENQLRLLRQERDQIRGERDRLQEFNHGFHDRLQEGLQEIQTLTDSFENLLAAWKKSDPDSARNFEYGQLVSRLRRFVETVIPPTATMLVVSKGDEELLRFGDRRAEHFPQNTEGEYAGFHPLSGKSAIIQLEALRAKGADYLLLPKPSFWWVEHYEEFRHHLESRYREVAHREDLCRIYALHEPAESKETSWEVRMEEFLVEYQTLTGSMPSILDWRTEAGLKEHFPGHTIFTGEDETVLPYFDDSVDLVAISSGDPSIREEARRVARVAVLNFEGVSGGVDNGAGFSLDRKMEKEISPASSVSIIIPTYNGIAHLRNCLEALRETLTEEFRGEIIVVDDASAHETREFLDQWARLNQRHKVIHNASNMGFIHSCNRGAEEAGSDYLLFLNDDTLPLPGWLPPLMRLFRDESDVGAVGGMLVYPDGRLQEAGAMIFSDGSGANIGRGDYDLEAPAYNFVREVDYCSGALLATRRALFRELGGFDTHYAPAYYEDTDYCFRVHEKGYRVVYQPESCVIHLEGATSGTDLSVGAKKHQALNREKFRERWERVLSDRPAPPGHFDRATWFTLALHRPSSGAES